MLPNIFAIILWDLDTALLVLQVWVALVTILTNSLTDIDQRHYKRLSAFLHEKYQENCLLSKKKKKTDKQEIKPKQQPILNLVQE